MKLALFGGTFDPVHRGHLAIARAAAKKFDLGLIYFVPADLPPHKGNRVLTDFRHRFAMLALATAEDQRFVPSLLEANSSQPNYSIHTVRRLKGALKKSDKLYFLIGVDAFMEISTWKQPVQLLAECDFIVASRPGYSLADVGEALPEGLRPSGAVLQALKKQQASGTIALPSTTIHLLSHVNERASSTQIRAAAGKSAQQLSRYVPEPVAKYIKKEHLYISTSVSAPHEKGGVKDGKVLSFRRAHHQESQGPE
jgi:nicotinate-nucleotide adenylyltransferase